MFPNVTLASRNGKQVEPEVGLPETEDLTDFRSLFNNSARFGLSARTGSQVGGQLSDGANVRYRLRL